MASNNSGFAANDGLGADIVKQGFLWVKRPPRSYWNRIKAWHKRYFVLRDSLMGNTSLSLLEMHSSQHDIKSNSSPLLSLELNETVHIGIASESHRFSNVLVLVCNGRAPLLLAADDELAARSWLLALDLTSQSRNTETGLMTGLPTAAKLIWNNNCCQNSICSTQSATDHHNNHHNSHHQNSESDSSTNGSACSCAPAFVRESSGFSDPTHGMSRSNQSSAERIPEDLLWTTDWHQNSSLEPGLVLERFQVYVLSTEASERACLRGQLQLVIFTRGVGVARIGDFECFLLWPIAFIRQYRHESAKSKNCSLINSTNKCDKRQTVVTLEVGRRCSTGEGVFSFRTSNGHEVMRQLKRAITNWAQYKANCRSNSRQSCSFSTTSTSHRSRYSRSRSSAPCTPNISKTTLELGTNSSRATTPSPRRLFKIRKGDAEPTAPSAHKLIKEKSSSTSDDINYVIPIFDDIDDNEEVSGDGSDGEYSSNTQIKTYDNSSSCRQTCDTKQTKVNNNSCNTSRNNSSDDNKCVDNRASDTNGVEDNPYLELIAT